MFNTEPQTIKPKAEVTEPCGLSIGVFPEEEETKEEQPNES